MVVWLFFLMNSAALGYYIGLAHCVIAEKISAEKIMIVGLGVFIGFGAVGVLGQPFELLTSYNPSLMPLVLFVGGVVGLVASSLALYGLERRDYPPSTACIAAGTILLTELFAVLDK